MDESVYSSVITSSLAKTAEFGNNRTMDHIVPKSRGGKSTWKNTVTCCRKCNSKKGSKLLSECNMKLIQEPFVPTNESLLLCIVEDIKDPWKRWFNKHMAHDKS